MNHEIKKMLDAEIAGAIEDLHLMKRGSEEHTTAVENLVKLYRLRIDENKADAESKEKTSQLLGQDKERYFKLGADIASIILPLIFYAAWMNKGFKFEETGTFTSTTFRGLFNRFKPTGK